MLPFIRVVEQSSEDAGRLASRGIALTDLTDPDIRIDHQSAMALLQASVKHLKDPGLGLRAGEGFQPGDLDVLEYASRSCSTLRQAISCADRYMGLMHGAQEGLLIESNDSARWELRITDGVEQPPAANDFALTSAIMYGRRYTGTDSGVLEVHFRHKQATDMAAYERIFGPAKIFLGAQHNALVLTASHLDRPMSLAHPALQAAYEVRANQLLERVKRTHGVAGRVRQVLVNRLNSGEANLIAVGRRLGMSAATLRRKLAEENTTFSQLLDALRRELSQAYLRDQELAISEVAFLLGFAHAPAFNKAFRRWWGGMTPSDYRAQLGRAEVKA
ncbi:MAG TPA: AraC family transcriptional regulator [Polyangiales bacterium]|nr:AraC family transcriptional regulator [Polyangiales bacterium]